MLESERGREILSRSTEPLRTGPPAQLGLSLDDVPYADLPTAAVSPAVQRDDVIIITARFRSGSTFLWNLFRHAKGTTAYYEPLNERRWFDPAIRGDRVDATHRQVDDYWREYAGLEELGQYYDEDWIRHRLYMDERTWSPKLKRYVEVMIEKAPGRPVLQFNRIDFRLAWFRRHFPQATILHLYRHPRDQWCSTLLDSACGPETTIAEFTDHFYLRMWTRDLQTYFPFLQTEERRHPYELFYLLWRLSYLFGRRFAHHSLAYESLLDHPEEMLGSLFSQLRMNENPTDFKPLFSPPVVGKWRNFASDDWFRNIETQCEGVLRDFFGEACEGPCSNLITAAGAEANAAIVG